MKLSKYEIQKRVVITFSMFTIILSMGLYAYKSYDGGEIDLVYEYINIKDMAQIQVSTKEKSNNIITNIINIGNTSNTLKEVSLPNVNKVQETKLPIIASATPQAPKQIWHLPTEVGIVTQYPSYSHMAYDITSPRGSAENIFPVANGVVTSMYTDAWGALIVTVLHDINGKKYTSQYVHLSGYDSSLYVGKPVTVNDSLGRMGTTGYSTGVHLHIAVLDCGLYLPGDPNCRDLNGFFRYGKQRYSQGFFGLGKLIYVPPSWNSR